MVTPNSPLKKDAAVHVAAHASESAGNWYDERANQIREVMKADGSGYTRCTLAHARKLDLAPGSTSIIKLVDKPALTLWKCRQAIMAALTLPRHDAETEGEWMRRVEEDMGKTAANAAEEGTRIHAAIQANYQGQQFDQHYQPHVEGAVRELARVCGKQAWRAEVPVVSRLGVGTKIDLLSDEWLIDWKGCDGDQAELNEKKTWSDHALQVAMGMMAADPSRWRKGAIGYVSRTHPGAVRLVGIPQKELEHGFDCFCALLHYWQKLNRYKPSWATETRL